VDLTCFYRGVCGTGACSVTSCLLLTVDSCNRHYGENTPLCPVKRDADHRLITLLGHAVMKARRLDWMGRCDICNYIAGI
jgi:hypothetical protein